jgi:hypothetical protein
MTDHQTGNTVLRFLLEIKDVDHPFIFNLDASRGLLLGRRDPEGDEAPDVDLMDYGAKEQGVSRKHASILHNQGSLMLVDHESANGTFLNGEKLDPHRPHVVGDGSEIRLGGLIMWIYLQ